MGILGEAAFPLKGDRRGPCRPLVGKDLRIHCNVETEGQIRVVLSE